MIKIEENSLYLLYRRGKNEHIKSLYENGEIYINTIDFIRKCDDNLERSDLDDGIMIRDYIGKVKIKFCNIGQDIEKYDQNINGENCIRTFDSVQKGNIYCLSGIYTKHITGKRENLEFNTLSFGESLIVIHNPQEFINRLIKGLKDNGFENIQYKQIEYYPNNYSGSIGFFKKNEIFSPQNEFRFFIPNEKNELIKILIGSIKDISSVENNSLIKVIFTDKKEQLIKI